MQRLMWATRGLAVLSLGLLVEHLVEVLGEPGGVPLTLLGAVIMVLARRLYPHATAVSVAQVAYLFHVLVDGITAAALEVRYGALAAHAVEVHALVHAGAIMLATAQTTVDARHRTVRTLGPQAAAFGLFIMGRSAGTYISHFAVSWLPPLALGAVIVSLLLLCKQPCGCDHHPIPRGS